MARKIRVGTTEPVLVDGRIRHCVVEGVTDQDTITVRLGLNDDPSEFTAVRSSSTVTRGFLFEESP